MQPNTHNAALQSPIIDAPFTNHNKCLIYAQTYTPATLTYSDTITEINCF